MMTVSIVKLTKIIIRKADIYLVNILLFALLFSITIYLSIFHKLKAERKALPSFMINTPRIYILRPRLF